MSEIAFAETAYYDALISNYLNSKSKNFFPKKKIIFGNLIEELRYGENPHQKAAIYSKSKVLELNQLNGKKLSYNNYNDIYSALLISKSLPKNTGTVIVKHANPCGVSINKNYLKSYQLALATDPISAFGGVVSCNFKIKPKLAQELNKIFLEVIVGNGIEEPDENFIELWDYLVKNTPDIKRIIILNRTKIIAKKWKAYSAENIMCIDIGKTIDEETAIASENDISTIIDYLEESYE